MGRWWFCRHGESVANAGGWLSGWEDVPLTALGIAQAGALAERVTELPIGRCLVSDLGRARRTAALTLRNSPSVPVHIDAGLRERHLGAFQGRGVVEVREDPESRALLKSWELAPEGGECHRELTMRALATLRRWSDGTPTLVVAHGALLRNLVGAIDGLSPEEMLAQPPLPNCTLVERHTPW